MALYKTDIPEHINTLLRNAAKRDGRSKEKFIHTLFAKAADKEQKQQLKESDND